ncbi:MAG: deoxyribonuclease V [Sandaracinaceae bacterium]
MQTRREVRFDLSVQEAKEQQRRWADEVELEDRLGDVRFVAGTDVAYEKDGDRLFAAVVVLDAETLEVVAESTHVGRAGFAYVPGLFSYRELPPLLRCFESLPLEPDLVVVDGQGTAHPRRFGLACHLGLVLDVPAIGCAKTPLIVGEPPGGSRGDTALVGRDGRVLGVALRTRDEIKPVYVSPGHRVSLDTAVEWVLRLTPRYRQPETTRAADQRVNRLRREWRPGAE